MGKQDGTRARDTERRMLDIVLDDVSRTGESGVEIQVRPSPLGRTLWVNVDGVCRLRVGGISADHVLYLDGAQYMSVQKED